MTHELKAASESDPLFAGAGEIAALMRAKDWSKTSLGPPHLWAQSLRTTVRILLTSRFSMWMGWGPQLNFFYNDAYRPTLGSKHPASLGRPARETWGEIWQEIGPRIEHVLESGEATWDEGLLLFLERSGYPEETYHTFSYSPLPDDDGKVSGMLCVVSEDTERILGQRRLAVLQEIAAAFAGANSDAQVFTAIKRCLGSGTKDLPFSLTYLFDGDGKSARLVASCEFTKEHAAASPTFQLDGDAIWPLARVRESGKPLVVDLKPGDWPRGPWDLAPKQALLIPIEQRGNATPAGVFVAGLNPHRALDDSYRDFLRLFVGQISAGLANARAYEDARQRAESLAELDRAKTVFFSNVSHEFRTPLTLMLGPIAELLGEAPADSPQHVQLALLQRNGMRLLKLVNTLLEFSRIEAGRVQASYQPTDLSELTADLASVFRSAVAKAGLKFTVDCQPLDSPVFVDRDMWEKIVFNLLSNAFKFTLAGEIKVSLRREGEQVLLEVADTGSGVPAHELPHLFDRFHRVEGTRGRTHEGTGIGLALVQELVRLHGGSIDARSEVDRGTTFSVRLPFGQTHLAQARVETRRPISLPSGTNPFVEEALSWLPGQPQAELSQAAGLAERYQVLLADDNGDMRDYIKRLLGAHWAVETVANGKEALEAIALRRPDLLITDAMMPVLDGFGLMRELRSKESTRRLPVLMLSARAGEEARMEALEAGASDYLVKPFAARELVSRVEATLLRSRMRAFEEAQARRLEDVMSQAPVAIAILRGAEHIFELANPLYRELIGGRELLGKSLLQALPELVGQGIQELLDGVFNTGQPFRSNAVRVFLERGGIREERVFDLVYQPLFHQERVDSIAVVAFEVTQLAQARQQAELANRAKDEFLAMLGHELRNPLAPILTALQLMRARGAGGERERGVIERQVNHLVGLVDDLLDISRITEGKIELRPALIELSDVVAQAVETASPLLEQHRHTLAIEVPRRGLRLKADAARLAQAVSNLLTNAAKYTPDGGQVWISARAEESMVVLSVRDSGIGIEPAMLSRIFDPFTQAAQAIDRSQGGLGLGLAIVRSLVSLHGGEVAARSDGKNRGSEFTLRLPLQRDAAEPIPTPVSTRRIEAVKANGAQRILVVDDNEDAAELLSMLLEDHRFIVRTAFDGPAALHIADQFVPEIAIFDLGLPVMDGYELAARFQENPALKSVKLIALTGYGQQNDRDRTKAAGFSAHLVKPVEANQLLEAVQAVAKPAQ